MCRSNLIFKSLPIHERPQTTISTETNIVSSPQMYVHTTDPFVLSSFRSVQQFILYTLSKKFGYKLQRANCAFSLLLHNETYFLFPNLFITLLFHIRSFSSNNQSIFKYIPIFVYFGLISYRSYVTVQGICCCTEQQSSTKIEINFLFVQISFSSTFLHTIYVSFTHIFLSALIRLELPKLQLWSCLMSIVWEFRLHAQC